MKKFAKGLYIFRRDLRLVDNTALLQALKECETVIPCFIFDPRQVGTANTYRSMNALQFMIESLQDLQEQLKNKNGKLYLCAGLPEKIVHRFIDEHAIEAVYCNKDYTPFSTTRDEAIAKICMRAKIPFISSTDLLLCDPEEIKNSSGQPYGVFTPFSKKELEHHIAKPVTTVRGTFSHERISFAESDEYFKKIVPKKNPAIAVHGGRAEALHILHTLKKFADYTAERDFPAIAGTTLLSAHNKFGTVSIREVFYAIQDALGKGHPLQRQLCWRDFFTYIAYFSPSVFGHAYHKKYDKIAWGKNKKMFDAWCEGKTGFPIVDAGMRQLNATGYMHNRVRMIVASFLTKDLYIDWRWGEQYFAQQLVDYDPCVNNGNWQWSSSTGCDAQPYFRIFNPWLQQKKFDPECVYIKQWVPELRTIDKKIIHTRYKNNVAISGYPVPIVDHAVASKHVKQIFKHA